MNSNNPVNPNPKSPSAPAYSKEQEAFLALCYAAFKMNKDGEKWLDFMKTSLLDKVPVADPSKDANHAYFREGQNSIVRGIFQNMNMYEVEIKKNNQTGA